MRGQPPIRHFSIEDDYDIFCANDDENDIPPINRKNEIAGATAVVNVLPINDMPSCTAFFRCTSPPSYNSGSCGMHTDKLKSPYQKTPPIRLQKAPALPTYPKVVRLESPRQMQALKVWISMVNGDNRPCLTDSVFIIHKGKAPRGFQVCVKRFGQDDGVINTNTHYPDFDLDTATELNTRFATTFRRIYRSTNRTHGIQLPELGVRLTELGFDYTSNAMLSWSSLANMTALVRALSGSTAMCEPAISCRE